MPETRKNIIIRWPGRTWPPFVIVLGVIAVIVWGAILVWLIFELVLLIL